MCDIKETADLFTGVEEDEDLVVGVVLQEGEEEGQLLVQFAHNVTLQQHTAARYTQSLTATMSSSLYNTICL